MQKDELNCRGKRLRVSIDFTFLYAAVKAELKEENLAIFTKNREKKAYYNPLKP
ncbi:hypothetical protein LMA04_15525 [Pseudescherichia vulneris]|uniref:hypothetical protein n=1 Tax=Pseudescherichia vulneris TaxID=566 RepID=UPI00227BF8D8|nr:hypothetical protein [Pseudescherichia vulneris]WAH51513.1 hypothetical protein LMA04_15525 [Pseudescherichia vulneris]